MKNQLKLLGLSINWDLELSTCNEDYYKHQQSLFIDFYVLNIPEENTMLVGSREKTGINISNELFELLIKSNLTDIQKNYQLG